MGLLSMLGLGGKSESISEFMAKGAVIVDVRTPGEYQGGHIKGSKNIPLNVISDKMEEIKNGINLLLLVALVACAVLRQLQF